MVFPQPVGSTNFNPRSRKGSDICPGIFHRSHADFNPRSRKGSDEGETGSAGTFGKFQSTLPQGERQADNPMLVSMLAISIHAPARGATLPKTKLFMQCQFQSTLPQGERPSPSFTCPMASKFQSTLPQGERPRLQVPIPYCGNFNPRSRKGSDRPPDTDGRRLAQISIHAPARGATRRRRNAKTNRDYFNPRSRKGSDGLKGV